MIQFATLDFGAIPQEISLIAGLPPLCRFGFATFGYSGYNGPLQTLNWPQQLLIPEYPGADSLQLFVPPYVNWNMNLGGNSGQGLECSTISGALNLGKQIFTGLKRSAPGNDRGSFMTSHAGTNMPTMNPPTKTMQLKFMNQWETGVQFPASNHLNPLLILLGFASEIAQQTVLSNMAETFVDVPNFTGAKLIAPVTGVLRSVNLQILSIPGQDMYQFGKYGAKRCGYYAWEYNSFLTPVQYWNTQKLYAQPPMPGATGFYALLQPGLTANGTAGVNEFNSTSLNDTLGDINFGANILTGLSS